MKRPPIYAALSQWFSPEDRGKSRAMRYKTGCGISGEASPSEADIKVTRDLIRAGQLLKIEVIDHVIMGNGNHCSLRELGYFYS